MEKTYKLFANCIPVKGEGRSAIYDLGRESYRLIPNGLYELLQTNVLFSEKEWIEENIGSEQVLSEYFSFLLEYEFIHECKKEELDCFPELDFSWDYPALITNAVIEIGEEFTPEMIEHTLALVDSIGGRFLQLNILNPSTDLLSIILNTIEKYRFNGIDFVVNHGDLPDGFISLAEKEIGKSSRRYKVIIEESNKRVLKKVNDCKDVILFIEDDYFRLKRKQKALFFNVNMDLFLESQQANNYLNRKLFINQHYEIKNAPGEYKALGKINEVASKSELASIVQSKEFQKYWEVTKNDITECHNCELRFMCVDNRKLKKDEFGEYYFEETCTDKFTVSEISAHS